jgi:hypothetical protein
MSKRVEAMKVMGFPGLDLGWLVISTGKDMWG